MDTNLNKVKIGDLGISTEIDKSNAMITSKIGTP